MNCDISNIGTIIFSPLCKIKIFYLLLLFLCTTPSSGYVYMEQDITTLVVYYFCVCSLVTNYKKNVILASAIIPYCLCIPFLDSFKKLFNKYLFPSNK